MTVSPRQGKAESPEFLVWALPYTHRSAGVRALYRLCHHLNLAGYAAAMAGEATEAPAHWHSPVWTGATADSIVIFPEIAHRPIAARRVVRWVLNDPGLLGGDTAYPPDEMVFVYDRIKLGVASAAAGEALGPARVLWMGLVDPACIYRDESVAREMDCSFTNKGSGLKERFALPDGVRARAIEEVTPTAEALGDVLRRTRTLYSWDHYSNVLREAHIAGCDIRVVGEDGVWHDPRHCDCALNIDWRNDLIERYAHHFSDRRFVGRFMREMRTRWPEAGRRSWAGWLRNLYAT